MKQTLLIVFFSFFALAAYSHDACQSEALPIPPSGFYGVQKNISIYPNPATHFISIDNDENVKEILLRESIEMVNQYKDTPGLLLYLLGNENNYGLYWEQPPIAP